MSRQIIWKEGESDLLSAVAWVVFGLWYMVGKEWQERALKREELVHRAGIPQPSFRHKRKGFWRIRVCWGELAATQILLLALKCRKQPENFCFNIVTLKYSLAFWWSFVLMTWKNAALLVLSLCDPLWKCLLSYVSVIFCKQGCQASLSCC